MEFYAGGNFNKSNKMENRLKNQNIRLNNDKPTAFTIVIK